jgi:hypothetical protein
MAVWSASPSMSGDMDANRVIAILSVVVLGSARRPPFAHSACLPEGAANLRSSTRLTMFAPCAHLNPIEQVLAKLKSQLRKADERSIEAVWRPIGELLDIFSASECANHIRHAGYASI